MSHRTLKAALVDYYHDRPHHEDETQEDVTDMLTDLRHLCVAEGIDFEQCNTQAISHFANETEGHQAGAQS